MPNALAEEMGPQVDVVTIFSNLGANIDVTHNKRRQVYPETGNITFANPNFLHHLNFPIKSGASADILSEKFKVYITERISRKYFGQDNPVGKIITFDEEIDLEVVGVLENTPRNTNTPFDLLISFPTLYEWNGNYARNWGSHWAASCYIVNHGQEDIRTIESLITEIAHKNLSAYEQERVTFTLQPIEEIHTDTRFDDDLNYVAPMEVLMGLAVMAMIILMASVLNFINLATAQAIQRSREVGIRKTLGSSRIQLVYQFLGETLLVVVISLLLALTLGQVFIDQLNAYLKVISYDVGYDQSTLLFTIILIVVVTFLAGLYPSWVLSRYEPAEALNNQITLSKGSGKKWLRRGLVIMQFVVANLLLITTLIVTSQMQFVKNKNLGFDSSNVGLIEFPVKMNSQIGLIKSDLEQKVFVENVTQAMSPPQYHSNWGTHYKISGYEQNERMHTNVKFIDQDYLNFYKIPLVSGRNLSNRYTSDTTLNVIVNREFLQRAGVPIENAVGRNISFMAEWKGQIIGVVEDFHVYGLQVAEIEEIFNKYGQGEYFAYEWLGDAIAENYIVENIAFRFWSLNYMNNAIIYKDEDRVVTWDEAQVYGSDRSVFEILDFEILAGDLQSFHLPQKAVLSRSTALKYFDTVEESVGKTFTLSGNNGAHDYEVVAIIEDIPENSHLDIGVLVSLESIDKYTRTLKNWTAHDYFTYLLLMDPTQTEEVESHMMRLYEEHAKERLDGYGYEMSYFLKPIEKIHTHFSGTDFNSGFKSGISYDVVIGKTGFRSVLVSIQFIITFLLIAVTISVYKQIDYMKSADLGFTMSDILVIKAPPGDVSDQEREDLLSFNVFKTEILKNSGVSEVTNGGELPGAQINWITNLRKQGKSSKESVAVHLLSMGMEYIDFFGMEIVAGRNLREGDEPWSTGEVLVNEKLIELLGYENSEAAIGDKLDGFFTGQPLVITGVVANHHQTSLHDDYMPIAYILSSWTEYYFTKFNVPDNLTGVDRYDWFQSIHQKVEAEWHAAFGDIAFDSYYLDQFFNRQYTTDEQFGKIFTSFAILAIIIASLGLFGLTSYNLQQRTKEIGIRKVLGAYIKDLVFLLSKGFIFTIIVAYAVSMPIAWILVSSWLEEYSFRIDLGIKDIEFSVGSGDANFQKSGSDNVSVKMEHTYNQDYNPTVEKRGSTLVIKEERRQGSYRGSSTWTLEIPDGLEVRFNTGSGDISIEDLDGDWNFNSGSGDFTLEDVKGELSINTGSGNVYANNVNGYLSFNTGSGDVEVTGAVGRLSANTGSGNIRANAITLQAKSSFNTGSGNSAVSFAQSPDYDVSVNTGSGDATVEFRGNDMEGLLVMEVNKRNGKIEAPFAFDSTEEIDNGGDLFAQYYEESLKFFPLNATMAGDNRYNDHLPNNLTQSFNSDLREFYLKYQELLKQYDAESLSEKERMSMEVLKWELDIGLRGLEFPVELMPINQIFALHLFIGQLASGSSMQPFENATDYDDWLSRVNGFKAWCDTAVINMRKGMELGYVLPSALSVKVIPQLRSFATKPVEENLFYSPVKNFPESIGPDDQSRLQKTYYRMVEETIIPTFAEMADFVENEYLPAGRESSGFDALPNGTEMYNHFIRFFTTTEMTADEIFDLGNSEVQRIRGEMEKVMDEVGFEGDLKAFFDHVRQKPELMPYSDPQQVIDNFNDIHTRMKPNIERLFDKKPKTAFEVRRTEAFREASASAEYNPGAKDGSRPGIFYVPIPDANYYNVLSDESLFLHEAIPGHHFQISLQMEDESLPEFRKTLWYSAYGEGWALYSESLGKELGLYDDPYQYFGMLSQEMHRAIRTTRVLQNTDYEEINNELPEWYSSDESVVNFEESEPDDPTDDPVDPDDPDPIDSSFQPDTSTLTGKWKAKANNYKIIFYVEQNADSVNYDVIGTITLTVVSFNLIDREIPFEGIMDSSGVMDVDISDSFSVNTFLGSDQVNARGELDGLFLLEGTADGILDLEFSSDILGTTEKQWNWTAVKIEN
ncbi:macB [Symbiodinium microadriaticum]|nr:macB [Symbiodinium microadriaticum]